MTGCSPGSTEHRKSGSKADLSDFVERLGHDFARPELLSEALTHPSALAGVRPRRDSRNPPRRGYDRLEFLGDRVLGLVVADLLWHRFADEPEGLLTRRLAQLVRRETLARVADGLDLGRHLVLSRSEATAGAATNPGILADACEAVIAAIYLDAGFAAAAGFVRRLWQPLIDETPTPPRDPKTALQEWAQARGRPLPVYELVATTGPDHAPRFTIAVRVAGREAETASAGSKRAAEAGAAALMLARLTTGE
ncbi:MAG: ribonuclease III [Stellaceae bacterium]